MDKVKLMYDIARLAFETDSTRSISLLLDSVNSPAIEFGEVKTTDGYHNLSHHGKSEAKMAQLKAIDEWLMRLLNDLFSDLKVIREEGDSLLDRTMILYGSNLGNANTHVTTNLPTIFAGGGFKHGQHLALTPIGTTRCQIFLSQCSSAWDSNPTNSPPRLAACGGLEWS
jgi:hypothetical protein